MRLPAICLSPACPILLFLLWAVTARAAAPHGSANRGPAIQTAAGTQDKSPPRLETPQHTATPSPAADNTLSVEARLVVVPAVVTDKHGLVTNLARDSFALSVDGKPQTVRYFDHDTDVPLTVGLLVDVSGSMKDNLDEEQKASRGFLESFLAPASGSRPADSAFVLQFARTAELLQDVTASRPLLAAGIQQIGTQAPGQTDPDDTGSNGNSSGSNGGNNGSRGGYGGRGGYGNRGSSPGGENRARGGTVLYDSLFLASNDVIGKQSGRRALIVLTDGEDRHSEESLTQAIEAAQRANAVVYAIYYKGEEHGGFGPDGGRHGGYGGYGGGGWPGGGGGNYPGSGGRPGSDGTYARPDGKKIMERICGETGGRVFEVKGKGSLESIYKEIGDELRQQYRLGFTPGPEATTAGYHHIQLTLTVPSAGKDEIQTRDGYYTGAPRQD